jgi:hypothetical protein
MHRIKQRICEIILSTPSAICGVKTENSGLKLYRNLRIICHIILIFSVCW